MKIIRLYLAPIVFLVIIFCAFIASCEINMIESPENRDTIVTVSYDYSHIVVQKDNIISEVYKVGDSLILQLEKGSHFAIDTNHILGYKIDHQSWDFTVTLTDSTQFNLYYLGDSLSTDNFSIQLNPHNKAPLTALVHFSTPLPRNVRFRIPKRVSLNADISHTFRNFTEAHYIPVYGLYADFLNTVYVDILDANDNVHITKTIKIQTEECKRPRAGFMTVVTNEFTESQANRLFLIQNCIYDGGGYIRWYTKWTGDKYFALSDNKIAIQIYGDRCYAVDPPHIRIIDYFGKVVDTFEVPNRNHHEINEKKPGGNLLVASNIQPSSACDEDTEDLIVEIDRETGEVVKEWDLTQIFDPTRPRLWSEKMNDWCHLNSIQYDSTDNTLLISSKLQYFISKIDYETGALKWIFGNPENWGEQWQPYLLTPTNFDDSIPEKDYTYAQHMPRLTPEGNILVYDNGGNRPGGSSTRVAEFMIDPEKMTVTKIWTKSFDKYASALGSVHHYDDNTIQVGHGLAGELYILKSNGDVIFKGTMKTFYRAYDVKLYE